MSSSDTPPDPAPVTALRCSIGRVAVGFARDAIDGMVELELAAAPPLSARLVTGLGFHEGELLVVLGFGARSAGRGTVPVVLVAGRHAGARWGVEVVSVGAFVRARRVPEARSGPSMARLPAWFQRAVGDDGKELRLLDLAGMLSEALAGPRANEASASQEGHG